MLLLESGLAYCALCVRVLLFGLSDRVKPLYKVVILVFDILTPNAITHADECAGTNRMDSNEASRGRTWVAR